MRRISEAPIRFAQYGKVALVAGAVAAFIMIPVSIVEAGNMAYYWSRGYGDFGNDVGRSAAVDASGNVYIVGSFEGTVDFGGGNLASNGDEDIFIAKYTQYGVHVWSTSFGDVYDDQGIDIAVDASGSIVVTGYFWGTVDLGGGALVSAGGRDIFVAKYSFNGVHMWSARYGSTFGNDEGRSIAISGGGDVVVAGEFGNTVNFGGANLTSNGNADVFVARFGTFGTHVWSQSFGGSGWDHARGVATNPSNQNVVVTGFFEGTVDFGGGGLSSAGLDDIFLAAYDAGGSYQWSKRFGDTNFDRGGSVVVDGSGNVIVTGAFEGSVNFGGGSLVGFGTTTFLAQYNAGGTHQWSRMAAQSECNDIAINGDDEIFVTGLLLGTGDFGGGSLASAGGFDLVAAWYGNDGTHIWSNRYGDAANQIGYAMAIDANGHPVAVGSNDGTIYFGGDNHTSAGDYDIFIAKWFGEIEIEQLDDCPNDRGLCGLMVWYKHFLDGPPIPVSPALPRIVRYSVYRAVGVLPAYPPDPICPGLAPGSQRMLNPCAFWTRVAVAVATGAEGYNVTVPTTADAPTTHYFAVIAEDDQGGFHISNIDSISTVNQLGAEITTVIDVPSDQGRKVSVTFSRDSEDTTGASTPILSYEIYRQDAAAPTTAPSGVHRLSDPNDPLRRIEGWTYVASTPAHGDAVYSVEAPTIGDSTISKGTYTSAFFVRATTASPATFFDTAPALGYSLDNLAPTMPTGFTNSAGMLSWDASPATDFDYFTVYGGYTGDVGAAVVVGLTTAVSMNVTTQPYALYFVTATDESGNEGPPASLYPPTGTGGARDPMVLSVSNYPNPFNPTTTVRYTVPSAGAVIVTIHDARGAYVTTIVDMQSQPAGAYHVEWNGTNATGSVVATGVYFARIVHEGASQTRKMVLLK